MEEPNAYHFANPYTQTWHMELCNWAKVRKKFFYVRPNLLRTRLRVTHSGQLKKHPKALFTNPIPEDVPRCRSNATTLVRLIKSNWLDWILYQGRAPWTGWMITALKVFKLHQKELKPLSQACNSGQCEEVSLGVFLADSPQQPNYSSRTLQ